MIKQKILLGNKMKTSFIILCKNNVNKIEIKNCLTSLHNNFNFKYNHKIVIFHENGFDNDMNYINSLKIPNINYHKVELKEPEEFLHNNYDVKWSRGNISKEKSLKYSNMCSFFACDIFDICKQLEIETYCRLDTDSVIAGKIDYDFLKNFNSSNLIYGYIIEQKEAPHVVLGLNDFIKNIIKKYNINTTFYNKLLDNSGNYNYRCFYNNFELLNVNNFYTSDVKTVLDDIKKSKNIYHYRWGDAPIRTFLCSLFVEEYKIKKYIDIDYTHLPFKNINKKCNIVFNNSILGKL